jgi:hypothetical protein
LSAVPLDVLAREIARRESAGDCLAWIITPSDLSEYWECDDAGATHPGSEEPNREEMRAIRKAFEVWQDVGGFSEIMNACRDAWNDAKGKTPWNGIDENTRDPLESDDDAPDVPSELGNPFETETETGESK